MSQPQALKSTAIRGVGWLTGAKILRSVSALVTLSIMSRFLPPEAFGLAGLIIFMTGLAQTFGDFGTRLAIIRKDTVNEFESSSAFWFNLGLGIALTSLCYVFAPQISIAFGAPGLTEPLRWATPIFALVGLQSTSACLLERALKFRALAMSEILGTVAGALVAVGLVLLGYGVGALVAQMVAISAVSTGVLILEARWRPKFYFSMDALAPLLHIGVWASLGAMVTYLGANLERPILAGLLSVTALGYFTMGQQIVGTPVRTIVQVVQKMMMPVFSKMKDDNDRASRAYVDTAHALFFVMSPICFGLLAIAEPMVRVVLGPNWDPIVPVIGGLSLWALVSVLSDLNVSVIVAKGHVRFQFWWSIFSMALTTLAIIFAARFGLVAVVLTRLGMSLILVPIFTIYTGRTIDLSLWKVISAVCRPALCGAVMAGGVMGVLQSLETSEVLRLILGIGSGLIIYPLAALIIDRRRSMSLLSALKNARRRS